MTQRFARTFTIAACCVFALNGCGSDQKKADDGFFTSGSREADQRADQRMAQANQTKGEGEGAGETKDAQEKRSLYDRLGGNDGLTAIVDDFVTRAIADPRVNWERKGVKRGGLSLSRGQSVEWKASGGNVKLLKAHLVQFFAVSTGGPPRYQGKEMKQAHENLQITNAEFDAAVGDLKASLDAAKIPNQEQRELLAIVESTRPQVVEER